MTETIFEKLAAAVATLKLDFSSEEFALYAEEHELSELEMAAVENVFTYLSEKKQQATVHTLLRLSRLPTKAPRTFENFDFSLLKGRDVERLKALPSLSAIYSHRNLAFIGPAGTGKTHLAQAFGYACCQHGMKTYFIKASELRDRFLAAKRSGKADSCLNALVRPSCLIIDEIGHCEFDKECTRMFFDLIDRRYNKEGNFIPDNDSSFNFIVGMLYTQLFQQLYYQADVVHGGRLPVHVHFVMDEFSNVALPDEFDKLLATMRSREISVSIIIQNLAQLKALFEKQWESLVGNCDEFLYMGGNEQSTHEYVSKLLGKETIDTNTYGQSKGRSGSYSTNWQLTGRELLMPDEVRMLDNQYALLFIRGERPVRDLKYDILKHPNIKLTTDGGAEPYRHGEDTHSIVSIRFDKELLKQAAEKDGQDAPKHCFILLTEEELEQKFIELEEQENAEQQKGK